MYFLKPLWGVLSLEIVLMKEHDTLFWGLGIIEGWFLCPTTFQKLFGLVQILYLTLGSIVVILFPAIFEFLMGNTVGLQEKYQFLPLMAYSVFCAVGNVFIYFSVYFDYAFRKLWDSEENKHSCSFFAEQKLFVPCCGLSHTWTILIRWLTSH